MVIDAQFILFIGCAFAAGYVVARLDSIYARLTGKSAAGGGTVLLAENRMHPAAEAVQKQRQMEIDRKVAAVSIDDSKFVAPIRTDAIQKVTPLELGTTTKQADTLNESVSKLAQLKGQ